MNHIKNYKDLLLEEDRHIQQMALSKFNIEENIKSYLAPKNLFVYFEERLEEKLAKELSEEFELKDYLISLSLDFLYEKVTDSLLKRSDGKTSGIDWKMMAKPIVDSMYLKNKHFVTDLVSVYIDKGIKKWTNR